MLELHGGKGDRAQALATTNQQRIVLPCCRQKPLVCHGKDITYQVFGSTAHHVNSGCDILTDTDYHRCHAHASEKSHTMLYPADIKGMLTT
jgi:hypothetical protein